MKRQRRHQYERGLESLSPVFGQLDEQVTVCLLDNTLKSKEHLPESLSRLLPPGSLVICEQMNSEGVWNKGAGDLVMWERFRGLLADFDMIFQYNPRLQLVQPSLMIDLIRGRNEFVARDTRGGARTGYFCLQSSRLLSFAASVDRQEMLSTQVGIEALLEEFVLNTDLGFTPIPPLGVRLTGLLQRPSPY